MLPKPVYWIFLFLLFWKVGTSVTSSSLVSCHYHDTNAKIELCLHPLENLFKHSIKRGLSQSHYTYPGVINLKTKRHVSSEMIYAEISNIDDAITSQGWRSTQWIVVTYNEIENTSLSNISLQLIGASSVTTTSTNAIAFYLNIFNGTIFDLEQHLTATSADVYLILQDHPLSMYSNKNKHISVRPINQKKEKVLPYNLDCRSGSVNGMLNGSFSWGIDVLDGITTDSQFCVEEGNDGTGTHAYVVDSGVYHHSTFQNRLRNDFDYYGTPTLNPHGTHVAGLIGSSIYGVAPLTTLHNIRVLDENGSGSFSSLLAGLLWISQNGEVGVINLSLGVLNAYSNPIASIIQNLISAGFVVIAAAGNDATDGCYSFPGNVPNVLTVGAFGIPKAKASFTNHGTCVEVYAPGVNIISAFGNASDSTLMSGTSMATPITVGVALLIKQSNPLMSTANIIAKLLLNTLSGIITGLASNDNNKLLHYIAPDAPPPPPPASSSAHESLFISFTQILLCVLIFHIQHNF